MWQETKDGLYKEFTFNGIKEAYSFIRAIVDVFEKYQLHPRWQHEDEKVQIWIRTGAQITQKNRQLAEAIDNIYKILDLRKSRSSPDLSNSAANSFSSFDV